MGGMSIEGVTSGLAPQVVGTAPAAGGSRVDLARLGEPAGGPLLEQARGAGAALAAELGRAGDAVATARLEDAVLGFAREVRALHIGCPDVPATARERAVDAAVAAGARDAAALPSVGLDAVDRLVTVLDGAARALVDFPAPPLVGPAANTQGA